MTTASRLSNNVTQKLSKAFGAGKFTISDKSGSNGEYGCFVLLQMLELYTHLSSHICPIRRTAKVIYFLPLFDLNLSRRSIFMNDSQSMWRKIADPLLVYPSLRVNPILQQQSGYELS